MLVTNKIIDDATGTGGNKMNGKAIGENMKPKPEPHSAKIENANPNAANAIDGGNEKSKKRRRKLNGHIARYRITIPTSRRNSRSPIPGSTPQHEAAIHEITHVGETRITRLPMEALGGNMSHQSRSLAIRYNTEW